MGIGKPGVEWEDRHLDGESQTECGKEPELFLKRQGRIQKIGVSEGIPGISLVLAPTPATLRDRYLLDSDVG